MKPQPPVTRIRTAPDTSSAAKVKHHTTATLIVNGKVVVELKSVAALSDIHVRQLPTQLRLSGLKLGLLINFGAGHLKDGIKRVIDGQLEPAEISDLAL